MSDDNGVAGLQRAVTELERQLDAVRSIAVRLSTTTKLHDLAREALSICLQLADCEAGSILLCRPEKRTLVFEHVIGEKAPELTGMEIGVDQGIAGKVFRTGESCVSHDVTKDSNHLREVGEKVGYATTNIVTVPLRSPRDEPIGVMQVLNKRGRPFDGHDVTLIEIMAAQIAAAIETARLHEQARIAAMMRFIGDISHDVKNMITPATSGAQTLGIVADDCFAKFDHCLRECGLSEEGARLLTGALKDLRELYPEIVRMSMDSSEAVQQRMAEISAAVKGAVSKPHMEPTDLGSIAESVEEMLRGVAGKKGVTIAVRCEPDLPTLTADPKQMYNAAYNLVFNAIDACREGDSVTLRVKRDSSDEVCIIMECEDTGPGMPDHVKAVAFTDDAISTKPMGTGLGTKIVRNVIDAHGGTIELSSEPGVGTIIRCRIPICRPGGEK